MGFSVVELLVVAAVISILAAIAFPVIVKARQQAQISECLSNMRQLGLAFRMYLDDYHDSFPAAVPWGVPRSEFTKGERTIQELLTTYVPNGMITEKTADGKYTYPQPSVFACPSDAGLPPKFDGFCGGVKANCPVWTQTGCSYEYFAANQKDYLFTIASDPPQVPRTALSPEVEISSRIVRIGAPVSAVMYPTKKAVLGDIWFWHLGDRVMPDDTVAYSNTLFVDGHAARVRGVDHMEARLQQLKRWHTYTELD
jgi:prepilin-type N-terminal cleavage/methylation domain-containing protein/prepilin-type processing-associated H-X9-DG protein